MYHTVLPGHTVYTVACTCTRVVLHMHTYMRQRVHRACRRDCKDRAPLLSLSPSTANPPSLSLVLVPVFMRVSMGKGSATRTRRKIISDLPRARRSCRPPYIARRSVLRRIFEMETHPPCADPPTRRRDSVPATFVRRNSKRKKKWERERKREKWRTSRMLGNRMRS